MKEQGLDLMKIPINVAISPRESEVHLGAMCALAEILVRI